MRITNQILHRESLSGAQASLRALHEAQARVSTGTRLQVVSDDPAAGGSVLRADSRLRALDQYRRNIDAAQSRLATEERVIDQLGGLLTRARELAISQTGSTATAQTRAAAKAEVDGLLDAAVALANTHHGDVYLFGGDAGGTAPFAADGTPVAAISGTHRAEVGAGQVVAVNHNGDEVFVDTGALAALRSLSTALGSGDSAAISSALDSLVSSYDSLQSVLAETGARANGLEIAGTNVEALEVNLRAFRSSLSDVELEEAVTALVNRQVAYQAALAATSRMLSTTLTDYLR